MINYFHALRPPLQTFLRIWQKDELQNPKSKESERQAMQLI